MVLLVWLALPLTSTKIPFGLRYKSITDCNYILYCLSLIACTDKEVKKQKSAMPDYSFPSQVAILASKSSKGGWFL